MSIDKLKGFAQDLGKMVSSGTKITDMKGIQKQLELKLIEKAEAKVAAALNQIDNSTVNVSKSKQTLAMGVGTSDPSAISSGLVEAAKIPG